MNKNLLLIENFLCCHLGDEFFFFEQNFLANQFCDFFNFIPFHIPQVPNNHFLFEITFSIFILLPNCAFILSMVIIFD
jgi:hypothetical protein